MKKESIWYLRICCCLVMVCLLQAAGAQGNDEYLLWSEKRRLSVADFAIKTKQLETTSSFAHFMIDYEAGGFSFLTKNFNKKVRNYFLKSASWIDTSAGLSHSLTYQQTLFDLAEIYTRQFRRALRENRNQFLKNAGFAKTLNQQFMTAFAERRVAYDRETVFGTKAEKQKAWELQIQIELLELAAFAFEK